MKCPHCRAETLDHVDLPHGPAGFVCERCKGNWVRDADYRTWQTGVRWSPPEKPCPDLSVFDSREAKLCPDCGRLLIRFKVHPDVSFRLEHCGGCGGMWFDEHEWTVLYCQGLHLNITEYFTPAWQQGLRRAEIRRHLELQMRDRFGNEAFERLIQVREWLSTAEHRAEMLAFLSSDDPFQ